MLARLDASAPAACWEWPGARFRGGYGKVRATVDGRRTLLGTHVVMFEHVHGPVPPDRFVLHTCDNPPCCNPAHLYAGTPGDNMRDRSTRGRAANQNTVKTHCLRGHPFDEDNTYNTRDGRRACRACARLRRTYPRGTP